MEMKGRCQQKKNSIFMKKKQKKNPRIKKAARIKVKKSLQNSLGITWCSGC